MPERGNARQSAISRFKGRCVEALAISSPCEPSKEHEEELPAVAMPAQRQQVQTVELPSTRADFIACNTYVSHLLGKRLATSEELASLIK